jgi:hypothetical protein
MNNNNIKFDRNTEIIYKKLLKLSKKKLKELIKKGKISKTF